MDLLNRILTPDRPSIVLEFLNTEVAPNAEGEKAIRLDLLMKSDDETIVDVEIQSGRPTELEQRACLLSFARRVGEQLKRRSFIRHPQSFISSNWVNSSLPAREKT